MSVEGGEEQGERSKEQGARSKEQGARSKEQGARSKEQGARSKEQGARSKEQGARQGCRNSIFTNWALGLPVTLKVAFGILNKLPPKFQGFSSQNSAKVVFL
jgi:hypothetical protein